MNTISYDWSVSITMIVYLNFIIKMQKFARQIKFARLVLRYLHIQYITKS